MKGQVFVCERAGVHRDPLITLACTAYVAALLHNGHTLEFFIEGGRSRDGGIQRPRLGLLSMVVNSQLEERCRKVSCMHIVFAYCLQPPKRTQIIHRSTCPCSILLNPLCLRTWACRRCCCMATHTIPIQPVHLVNRR